MEEERNIEDYECGACRRISSCDTYRATNPNLRESYCFTPESKNCFYGRGEEEKGMFTFPRGGVHYIS